MISIIIPVLNEENAVVETIIACRNVIDAIGDINSEIIIVDDASIDNTYNKVLQSKVNVIRHNFNMGYGKSLKDGIVAAKNDTIIITDADGTYPIEAIPLLLNVFNNRNAMVVGERKWKTFGESFIKKTFRKILRSIIEYATNRNVPDVNSGLRIFSKKEILPFLPSLCDTFSFTTSLTLAYMMTEKLVDYLPIDYNKRIGKTKVKPIKDTLKTLQFIIQALNKYNPLKLLMPYCIFLFSLAIIIIVIALTIHIHYICFVALEGFLFFSLIIGIIVILQKSKLKRYEHKQR